MRNIEIFCQQFFEYGGYKNFLKGLSNTAMIAVFGLLIGFLIGCVIATVKLIPSKKLPVKIANGICDVYVALFRGTPMVVQLLLMHFALFPALGLNIEPVMEAVIIFGMNSAAYMAEILRSGINAVDIGQMEAGRSLGFGYAQSMVFFIMPQAFKAVLPALANEFITLLKESSVAFYIGVADLTKGGLQIRSVTYSNFMPLIAVALIYLIIVVVLTKLVGLLERRLRKSEK